MLDQCGEGRSEPALVRLAQRGERAAAAFDEERRLPAEKDHLCAGDSGGPRAGSPRPRERGPVGLCGIGGCEHERVGLLAFSGPKLAEPLDRSPERELRSA